MHALTIASRLVPALLLLAVVRLQPRNASPASVAPVAAASNVRDGPIPQQLFTPLARLRASQVARGRRWRPCLGSRRRREVFLA